MNNAHNAQQISHDAISNAAAKIYAAIKEIGPNQNITKAAEPIIVKNIQDLQGKLSPNGLRILAKMYPRLAPQLLTAAQTKANSITATDRRPPYIPSPGDQLAPTYVPSRARDRELMSSYVENLNLKTPPPIRGADQVIYNQEREAKAEKFKEMSNDGNI